MGSAILNNNERKKYLFNNTLVFALGNFGSKLIVFFLVPLYTNVLTTAEYGTLDLINIISTVIVPIITLNIAEAIMRFVMDKGANRNEILNVGTIIFIFSLILSLLAIPILNSISYLSEYAFILCLYIITLASSTITLCYVRGIEKLLDYAVISIIQTLIIVGLNVLLLLKFNMGIKGYIISYVVAYAITTLICIIRSDIVKIKLNLIINKVLMKKMLKYSILLIPNSLMGWVMNSLDRVMVTEMIGISENGIYAVSYKIPTILITLTTIFNQAWMFSAVKEKESTDKEAYTNTIFNALFIVVTTIASLLICILKPLLLVYVGNDFFGAWLYTSPLLVGTVFLTLGTFLSNEYTAHKDSMGFLKSSCIGALINLILNFTLIPLWGVLGAAVATCVSYITVFIFRLIDTRKYVKIYFINKKRIISLIIILINSILIYIESIYVYIPISLLIMTLVLINLDFWKSICKNFIKQLKGKRKDEK